MNRFRHILAAGLVAIAFVSVATPALVCLICRVTESAWEYVAALSKVSHQTAGVIDPAAPGCL